MADMIERYVYDVVRRLPDKERGEVSRELNASIYDMLPENAGDTEIRETLTCLGSPAELAEKYRSKPRYLISPGIYDDYIRALKWVLPLVGCLMLALGAVFGAINTIKDGADVVFPNFITSIISSGLEHGCSAVLFSLLWITAGFAIADRSSAKKASGKCWNPDQLPDIISDGKFRIPLSDSIVELVITVVAAQAVILLCSGTIPFSFELHSGDVHAYSLFSSDFLLSAIPVVITGAFLTISECVAKIVFRRWTPALCAVVVVSNLASIGLMVYLFTRPEIMSPDFVAFARDKWPQMDSMNFMGAAVGKNLPLFITGTLVTAFSLAECGFAISKTVRAAQIKE